MNHPVDLYSVFRKHCLNMYLNSVLEGKWNFPKLEEMVMKVLLRVRLARTETEFRLGAGCFGHGILGP